MDSVKHGSTLLKGLIAVVLGIAFSMMLAGRAYALDTVDVSTYSELRSALESNQQAEVVLTADIAGTNLTGIDIAATKTLNLNGHSIDGDRVVFYSLADGDLTVTGNGSITDSGNVSMFYLNGGNITVENGTFENTGEGDIFFLSTAGSSLTINGGTFINSGSYQVIHSQCSDTTNAPTITINGGVFIADNDSTNNGRVWGSTASDTTIATINSGTFYSKAGAAISCGWPSNDSNKHIGSGKVLYGNGNATTITSSVAFTTDLLKDYRIIQVGSSSDFAEMSLTQPDKGWICFIDKSRSITANISALKGAPFPVYAEAADGYFFNSWTATNATFESATSQSTYAIPSGAATIGISYKAGNEYNVATSIGGSGTISATETAIAGVKVTFSVSPNSGYALKSVRVTDAFSRTIPLTTVGEGEYSFTMPESDVTISATFAKLYSITVNGSIQHGSIQASKAQATVGEEIVLSSTPQAGYVLAGYEVTDSDSNPISVVDDKFTMPESNVYVNASFAESPGYAITTSSTGDGSGILAPSSESAKAGTTVTITANANSGSNLVRLCAYYIEGGSKHFIHIDGSKITMPMHDVIIEARFDTKSAIEVSTWKDLRDALVEDSISSIKLTDNLTLKSNSYADIIGQKDLDLGKHSIAAPTIRFTPKSGGSLTIKGGGRITATDRSAMFSMEGGDAVIEKGTFENTGEGEIFFLSTAGSSLTINGGTFINSGSYQVIHSQCTDSTNAPTITINGGVFIADNDSADDGRVWGSPASDTTIATINSGTFYSKPGAAISCGWPNKESNKRIGADKVLYGNGSATTITSLVPFSTELLEGYFFIQVGSVSDFNQIDLETTNAKASFIVNKATPITQISALAAAPIPVFASANDGYTLKPLYSDGGRFDEETYSVEMFYPTKACSVHAYGEGSFEIAGTTRYETAAKIATTAYPDGSDGVIVATGESFPDALAATSLAGELDYPIVLTSKAKLNGFAEDAIKDLRGSKDSSDFQILVIGGEGAVSKAAFSSLSSLGNAARIQGSNRYDTACQIYEYGKVRGSGWSDIAIIATGKSAPDALSVASFAAAKKYPIFLCSGTELSSGVKKALKEYGFSKVVIVGGTGVVSDGVETWVKKNVTSNVERKSGPNRYETSLAIANWAISCGASADQAGIATGKNFPDALAGGVLLGKKNTVLLLADPGSTKTLQLLGDHCDEVHSIYFLGGTGAVPQSVRDEALRLAQL